ncbi:MAG: DNA repair protein RadC [Acidobacteriota bacterium]
MQNNLEKTKIKELPRSLQPRERLISYGVSSLSNPELMAILLGTGTRKENVLRIADKILKKYRLTTLPEVDVNEWRKNSGVGKVQACRLIASFELGRRIFSIKEDDISRITKPQDVYREFKDLRKARKEHLCALYLNAQNQIIRKETISVGSLNTTRTHPREILQPAISNLALGFILVHNHPGGSLQASNDDIEFTKTVKQASDIMGIELYDHVIIADGGFLSLKENGFIL